jgi:hypothetical protein
MIPITEMVFILVLVSGLLGLFLWGNRVLPREDWQFLAIVPRTCSGGSGEGTNLTFYGVFTATGVVFAVLMLLLLLGSIEQPVTRILGILVPLLALTVPSAKVIARMVEGKTSTLTIGGASFVGMLAAPWVIWGWNRLAGLVEEQTFPIVPTLAALWIAYAFGEGLGRLACLSFGCCYGKPLAACHPVLQRLFKSMACRFFGKTKKAVYAAGLEGIPLFPIQAVTAVVNAGLGILGTLWYLHGWSFTALVIVALGTQGWRVISELFRMDYRGTGFITAYQGMAVVGALYSIVLAGLWTDSHQVLPQMEMGLKALWDVQVWLIVQAIWLGIFFFTGVSRVTRADISTRVRYERV